LNGKVEVIRAMARIAENAIHNITATAAIVRNGLKGKTFLDTLTFIKVNKDWLIYGKLYHIEA